MIFDLIAMQQEAGGGGVWTPADLFQNGEIGFWLDGSDYSTMFQELAGTTPVTALGQPIGLWKNKIGQSAFDFHTATAAARPVTVSNSGKLAVRYDGVDDQLVTTDTGVVANSGITVSMGQKLGAIATSRSAYTGATGQAINIQNQSNQTIFTQAYGLTLSSTELWSVTAANILTLFAQINTHPITIRVNGIARAGSTPTVGTVGSLIRIPGSSLLFSDISQAVFINRVLTPAEITLLETFIASKQ